MMATNAARPSTGWVRTPSIRSVRRSCAPVDSVPLVTLSATASAQSLMPASVSTGRTSVSDTREPRPEQRLRVRAGSPRPVRATIGTTGTPSRASRFTRSIGKPAPFGQVDHVERHDQAHVAGEQLADEHQVAGQVAGVDDDDDDIGRRAARRRRAAPRRCATPARRSRGRRRPAGRGRRACTRPGSLGAAGAHRRSWCRGSSRSWRARRTAR